MHQFRKLNLLSSTNIALNLLFIFTFKLKLKEKFAYLIFSSVISANDGTVWIAYEWIDEILWQIYRLRRIGNIKWLLLFFRKSPFQLHNNIVNAKEYISNNSSFMMFFINFLSFAYSFFFVNFGDFWKIEGDNYNQNCYNCQNNYVFKAYFEEIRFILC